MKPMLHHPVGIDAITSGALVAAGFIPGWFTNANLQMLYFCLVIPPAAYHGYVVIKKAITDWINKI